MSKQNLLSIDSVIRLKQKGSNGYTKISGVFTFIKNIYFYSLCSLSMQGECSWIRSLTSANQELPGSIPGLVMD